MSLIRKEAQNEYMEYWLVPDKRWWQIWGKKWLTEYLDDASRFKGGYGIFQEAITENANSTGKMHQQI